MSAERTGPADRFASVGMDRLVGWIRRAAEIGAPVVPEDVLLDRYAEVTDIDPAGLLDDAAGLTAAHEVACAEWSEQHALVSAADGRWAGSAGGAATGDMAAHLNRSVTHIDAVAAAAAAFAACAHDVADRLADLRGRIDGIDMSLSTPERVIDDIIGVSRGATPTSAEAEVLLGGADVSAAADMAERAQLWLDTTFAPAVRDAADDALGWCDATAAAIEQLLTDAAQVVESGVLDVGAAQSTQPVDAAVAPRLTIAGTGVGGRDEPAATAPAGSDAGDVGRLQPSVRGGDDGSAGDSTERAASDSTERAASDSTERAASDSTGPGASDSTGPGTSDVGEPAAGDSTGFPGSDVTDHAGSVGELVEAGIGLGIAVAEFATAVVEAGTVVVEAVTATIGDGAIGEGAIGEGAFGDGMIDDPDTSEPAPDDLRAALNSADTEPSSLDPAAADTATTDAGPTDAGATGAGATDMAEQAVPVPPDSMTPGLAEPSAPDVADASDAGVVAPAPESTDATGESAPSCPPDSAPPAVTPPTVGAPSNADETAIGPAPAPVGGPGSASRPSTDEPLPEQPTPQPSESQPSQSPPSATPEPSAPEADVAPGAPEPSAAAPDQLPLGPERGELARAGPLPAAGA